MRRRRRRLTRVTAAFTFTAERLEQLREQRYAGQRHCAAADLHHAVATFRTDRADSQAERQDRDDRHERGSERRAEREL